MNRTQNKEVVKNEDCCCNCIHQLPLVKHPENKTIGYGSMQERMGWACLIFMRMPDMDGSDAVFMDSKHGLCELHHRKPPYDTIEQYVKGMGHNDPGRLQSLDDEKN